MILLDLIGLPFFAHQTHVRIYFRNPARILCAKGSRVKHALIDEAKMEAIWELKMLIC